MCLLNTDQEITIISLKVNDVHLFTNIYVKVKKYGQIDVGIDRKLVFQS